MTKKVLTLIIASSLLLFSPSLTNFFFGDDWFHLRVSRIQTLSQFVNFFSFSRTPQSITSYRPIPSQVFFFFFHSLFGLNPLPYHLFALAVFGSNIFLVYHLARLIFSARKPALLSAALYGLSADHFTALYSIASFQEIALVFFVLSTVLAYHRAGVTHSRGWLLTSLACFIMALASKETAVVTPFLLVGLDWLKGGLKASRVLPFLIILAPYLFLRLFVFGVDRGAYQWDFSPKKTANTAFWYTLWSFGTPELLVDYVSSGLRPVAGFFRNFPLWSWWILASAVAGPIFLAISAVKSYFKNVRISLFAFVFFLISLLPVIFLPWHKFTLELGLPLVGFVILISSFYSKSRVFAAFCLLFTIVNVTTNNLMTQTHYTVNRARLSAQVFNFFSGALATYPKGYILEFINDSQSPNADWGSSKQIAQAVSFSDMARVIYHNSRAIICYQDYPGNCPSSLPKVYISSKTFLNPKP